MTRLLGYMFLFGTLLSPTVRADEYSFRRIEKKGASFSYAQAQDICAKRKLISAFELAQLAQIQGARPPVRDDDVAITDLTPDFYQILLEVNNPVEPTEFFYSPTGYQPTSLFLGKCFWTGSTSARTGNPYILSLSGNLISEYEEQKTCSVICAK